MSCAGPARFEDAAVVADDDDAVEIVGDDLVQHGARLVALARGLRVHPPAPSQRGDEAAEGEERQRDLDARASASVSAAHLCKRQRARLDAEAASASARDDRQRGDRRALQRAGGEREREDQRDDGDERRRAATRGRISSVSAASACSARPGSMPSAAS